MDPDPITSNDEQLAMMLQLEESDRSSSVWESMQFRQSLGIDEGPGGSTSSTHEHSHLAPSVLDQTSVHLPQHQSSTSLTSDIDGDMRLAMQLQMQEQRGSSVGIGGASNRELQRILHRHLSGNSASLSDQVPGESFDSPDLSLNHHQLHSESDFNPEDYEMLLALDSSENQEKKDENCFRAQLLLSQLPVITATERHAGTQCAICLETTNRGDELRTLPCLHAFHRDCIDTWLTSGAEPRCPIDQVEFN